MLATFNLEKQSELKPKPVISAFPLRICFVFSLYCYIARYLHWVWLFLLRLRKKLLTDKWNESHYELMHRKMWHTIYSVGLLFVVIGCFFFVLFWNVSHFPRTELVSDHSAVAYSLLKQFIGVSFRCWFSILEYVTSFFLFFNRLTCI